MNLTKVPEYLRQQRWFGGKAWPIKSVSVVDHASVDIPGRAFLIAIVEVLYELGHPERYQLPVEPAGADTDEVKDALEDDDCLRALFQIVRDQRTLPSGSGRIVGEWLAFPDALPPLPDPITVRRLNVEQSNTSVVFAERVILKVLRKLEAGINPEYEVGRFLATKTKFRATPTLIGALQLDGPAGATLSVVHQFVPNAEDGWKYTLDVFKRHGAPPAAFLAEMRDLGTRLGELHSALASDPNDPAFAPEEIHHEDLDRWSASIIGELGVTLADASKQFPELEKKRDALVEVAKGLARTRPGGQKIRVHGDLHLGQTLRSKGEWLIFDFEGEPSRSFAQRREKYSPLKDVAGMLRSFDYAAASVELQGGEPADRVTPARQAFLEGYRKATRGAKFLPERDEDFMTRLAAFELEKLLYEVRYELQNRPDWVRIPVRALLRMEVPK
ncbi:sugar phosphotransferase [Aggregicoccus sp. 17bor-14]|uniref:maltokinase N-terminal cap-like domain-containing protein n=1 Tax=Myxococcaceae TaxID=31 RepID=UPI00351A715D